jgi:hypothetical protein
MPAPASQHTESRYTVPKNAATTGPEIPKEKGRKGSGEESDEPSPFELQLDAVLEESREQEGRGPNGTGKKVQVIRV